MNPASWEVPLKKTIAIFLCLWLMVPVAGFAAEGSFVNGTLLKKGFTGPEVRLLQQSLKIAGFYEAVQTTEHYGDATEAAVKAFQVSVNIPSDGIAGNGTIGKLNELGWAPILHATVYKPELTYMDLPVLQAALHSEGLYQGSFGSLYDQKTRDSVTAFQMKYGLAADGVVGKGTLDKLNALKYVSLNQVVVSRGAGKRTGIPINWYDIKPMLSAGKTVLTVEDFRTGTTFNVQVSYCATVHADIETLTQQDTETVRKLWGGFSWDRRPVLIHFNGEVYAASMNGLPHAGLDSQPEGATVGGRSGGFGSGYNFDDVKGNGIDGHFCLHFVDSRTHGGNKIDEKHQVNIRIAAGQ